MATFQTYQSIGNREDLTDILTNIAPMDTWFTSTSGTASAKGTYHEWQTDTLASAAANAKIEGAAASDGTVSPTTRLGNYTQILEKCFKISKTEEAIDKAGRKSEIAYQTEKHMKELARDIEYALLINANSAVGASATARTLKGVIGFITTNVETGTGTASVITDDILNDALEKVWDDGGKPSTILVGSKAKRQISSLATTYRQINDGSKDMTNAVDVYNSDFGAVAIRLHHIINVSAPGTAIVFGDMGLWAKAWLRGVKRQQEPFAGDADLFTVRCELTLEAKQEAGSGKMTNISQA
jgi:hypothetical protein